MSVQEIGPLSDKVNKTWIRQLIVSFKGKDKVVILLASHYTISETWTNIYSEDKQLASFRTEHILDLRFNN